MTTSSHMTAWSLLALFATACGTKDTLDDSETEADADTDADADSDTDTDADTDVCTENQACGTEGVCVDGDCLEPSPPTLSPVATFSVGSASWCTVDAQGRWAYVSCLDGASRNLLHIFERTDAGDIVRHVEGWEIGNSYATYAMLAVGDHLFVGHQGLEVVDISDPSSPTLLTSVDTDSNVKVVFDMRAVGDRLLARGTNGLHAFDITDPTDPVWTNGLAHNVIQPDGWVASAGTYGEDALVGDYWYTTWPNGGSGANKVALVQVDISDPDALTKVSDDKVFDTTAGATHHVRSMGQQLFVGWNNSQNQGAYARFDVSSGSPVAVAEPPNTRHTTSLLEGRYLWGQNYNLVIEVWDVGPEVPTAVGTANYTLDGNNSFAFGDDLVWAYALDQSVPTVFAFAR